MLKCKHINKEVSRIYFLGAICWEHIQPQIERRSTNCLFRELKSRANVLFQKLPEKREELRIEVDVFNVKGKETKVLENGAQNVLIGYGVTL